MQAHLATVNEASHGWVERTEECGDGGAEGGTWSKTKTVRKRDWRAAAFMLERRFPDEFGPKTRGDGALNVDNHDGGKVIVIHAPPPGRVIEGNQAKAERAVDPTRPKVRLIAHNTDEAQVIELPALHPKQANEQDGSVANQ